eukprot:scaffold1712_cov261-Pinguiococcus_pyrenoidosus.AAC.2
MEERSAVSRGARLLLRCQNLSGASIAPYSVESAMVSERRRPFSWWSTYFWYRGIYVCHRCGEAHVNRAASRGCEQHRLAPSADPLSATARSRLWSSAGSLSSRILVPGWRRSCPTC